MAEKKKSTKKEKELKETAHELVEKAKEAEIIAPIEEAPIEDAIVEEKKEKKSAKKEEKSAKKGPMYPVGSVVYVNKNVLCDLNGFNLSISQYKKATYTVEAYNEDTGVYKIRHLKLLLNLKESDLVAPDANAHDQLNRMQF